MVRRSSVIAEADACRSRSTRCRAARTPRSTARRVDHVLATSDTTQCFAIMDTYFPEDEEPEIEAQVGEGGQFAFNDQLAAPSGGFSFGDGQSADDSMAS